MQKEKTRSITITFYYRLLPIIIAALLTACGAGGGGSNTVSNSTNNVSNGIGSNGGTVASSDGKVKVVIPAGALNQATDITVSAVSKPPAGNVGTAYDLGPAGTIFTKPVTISITYDKTALPSGVNESDLKIGTINNNDQWEVVVDSTVDTIVSKVVSGTTTHFGTYGILFIGNRDEGHGSMVSLSITPESALVATGGSQTFSAIVTGSTNTKVTWDIKEGASGGVITDDGTYTAPLTAGTYHIIVTSYTDPTKSAMIAVDVISATNSMISISINPILASVDMGGSQTFSATVNGSTNTDVIWSVWPNTTGGKITRKGVYTAPSTPGNYLIIASSQADPNKIATSNIDIIDRGSMLSNLEGPKATMLSNGNVLLTGGRRRNTNVSLSSAKLYDSTTSTFATTSSMTTARSEHTATMLSNGKVLIAGGSNASIEHSPYAPISSAELYDPASGIFTTIGNMTTKRSYHTATLLSNGKVLIAGGYYNDTAYSTNTAELYDPYTGTFTATGSMTSARSNHKSTLLSNGKVLIVGGSSASSAELYDPSTGTFSATGSMTTVRAGCTATLLPNGKVLIAGGFTDGSLSGAELYDPAIGTFTATGNMTTARSYHNATLLSNGKVLIVGGYDTGSLYSAELYNPSTGIFSATGNMILARYAPTATLLSNGNVLIAGGLNRNGNFLFSAELYDLSTSSFTAIGSMDSMYIDPVFASVRVGESQTYRAMLTDNSITEISWSVLEGASGGTITSDTSGVVYKAPSTTGTYHIIATSQADPNTNASADINVIPASSMLTAGIGNTATLLSNGEVLIAGGSSGSDFLHPSTELYDPSTGTLATTGSSMARSYHTATLLSNGKVLIAGGYTYISPQSSTAELYDLDTETFTTTGNMTTARSEHTATLLTNGKVLIAGGQGSVSSAELYDPSTGTFTATGSMATARLRHTATLLSNGKVLIAGGFTGGSLSGAELYDPATGTFTSTGNMTTARSNHTATLLSNGKVLIVGGGDGISSAELYDPSTGTFTATGSMATARLWHTATLLSNGKALIAGGYTGGSLSSAELYDTAIGTFTTTGSMNTARSQHTATLLSNGKVLIAGGRDSSFNISGSTELYDQATGTFE